MTESTIITGQFVRISQTPASIGERLLALVIDYSLIVIYLYSVTTLIVKLHLSSGVGTVFFLCLVYLPVLFYSFLCEMFNHGQSFGKRLMNIRVVKSDGSTPSISAYLLRWLLFIIDGPGTCRMWDGCATARGRSPTPPVPDGYTIRFRAPPPMRCVRRAAETLCRT